MEINRKNFVQKFVLAFLPEYTVKYLKKNNCYPPNGYLWNSCALNLVSASTGLEAMIAYDEADKEGAYEFQYDNGFMGDEVAVPLSIENDTAEKIEKAGLLEFYIIGKNFSWCYIVSHEKSNSGPFFISREK